MKRLTPLQVTLLVSLLVAILSATIVLAYGNVKKEIVFIIFIVTGITTYVTISIFLKYFIYDRIKVIYKTISHFKATGNNHSKEISLLEDSITVADKYVLNWQEDYTKEINELKQTEQYQKDFLGNVSHELKTPLFNIQGYILTLLDGGIDDKNVSVNYLKRAERSVERMVAIVDDLQSITQLERGSLELDYETFNIIELAAEVINALEFIAEDNAIQLRFDKEYTKPIWVSADKFRIRQVFVNLLMNAIRYSNNNGYAEVRFFDMDELCLVEVADNGVGIDPKHFSRIFERFYRVDKHRSREHGGSGLGLAIVKHIIEAHNQKINVRSAVNVGSTFAFTLKKK